uniref:Uncharacterized protein n=1 Tax=Anguilla anguilla TaxID=7936 RepID=A0A0E9R3L6_ANGAN
MRTNSVMNQISNGSKNGVLPILFYSKSMT